MNKDKLYEELCAVCTHVERDAALSEYTTFKVGGPADLLIKPGDLLQLMAVMFIIRREQIPYVVLGNGSNVLVKDGGFRGAVILLEAFEACEADPDTGIVSAGAGALLGEVAKAAARASLTGLEFAAGIPGSLGGGVFMNAGAYGGELSQVITEVVALMPDGLVHTFPARELDFGYRHSVFCENGGIVLSAEMQLAKGDPEKITETMKDLNRRRVEKQPLNYPSAGSTFKRPEGYFAGKLIQDAGCRGLSVGGALVSPKHAGFIVNKGGATAQDILDLIHLVQLRVKETSGVDLETEVRIIGE
ncbi:MAG: UDP-N-acetylmuramate dehydrogenase [Anaerovoracaceae bacterium]